MPYIYPRNAPLGLQCNGGTVTNLGHGTVYYADSSKYLTSTSNHGSIAPGGSTTLEGVQYFISTDRAELTVAPASQASATSAGREVMLPLTIDGSLSVNQKSRRFPLSVPGTIRSVSLATSTGPVGAALLVDVLKNGTSIFTTPENPSVPFVVDGGFDSPAFGPTVTQFAAGDDFEVQVTQVGSSTAGTGLTAMLHLELTGSETVIAPATPPAPQVVTAYQSVIRHTPGVVAYWRMNDATGTTTVLDDVGNFDGTLKDTYTLQSTGLLTTEADPGISFTGGGGSIQVPGLSMFTGTNSFTFEGWIKPTTVDTVFRRILIQLVGGTGYGLFNRSGTGFYFTRQIAGDTVNCIAPVLTNNATVHFAVTYDGQTIRLYVNGALAQSAADTRSMPVGSTAVFNVSQETYGGGGLASWLGTSDEFAVYNVALSATTISDHYTVGSGITPAPPPPPTPADVARINRSKYSKVALFAPLDETSGTTVTAQQKRLLMFEKGGWINGRLADDAPLDPDPNGYANHIAAQAITPGSYFNVYSWSTPIYIAPHDVSYIKVSDTDGFLNQDNSPYKWGSGSNFPFKSAWRSADAEFSESTYRDRHLTVWDPNTGTEWEAFHVIHSDANPQHNYPNVQATHGGKIDNAPTASGTLPTPYGARATGLALPAGVIRLEEMALGEIPHCIAFATVYHTAGLIVSPATRADAASNPGANVFPYGGVLRLPPDFDVAGFVNTYKPSYVTELMLYAIQRYGMICVDGSPSMNFYGEDPRDQTTGVQSSSWGPYLTSRVDRKAITGVASTDVITCANHGFGEGAYVYLFNLSGGAGLSSTALQWPTDVPTYNVKNKTQHTFQLAATPGGAAIDFTTDIASGQVGVVHEGWRVARPQNFPYGSLQLLPPYDPANTHRTPSTFNDLTGTHSGAVAPGQTSLTTGGTGKSTLYTGGKTTFADQPIFDVGATCTIRALTKTTTVAAGEAIILHRDVYELKRSGSSLIGSVTIGGVQKSVTATSVFSANTLADVALTYDGANVKLWKNGVQAGSSTAATGSVDASTDAITVGSLSDGSKTFSGQLQHVEVLQEALPVGRLAADYTAATT